MVDNLETKRANRAAYERNRRRLSKLYRRIEGDPEQFMASVDQNANEFTERAEHAAYNQTRRTALDERINRDPETFMRSVALHAAQFLAGRSQQSPYFTHHTEKSVALRTAELASELVPLPQEAALTAKLEALEAENARLHLECAVLEGSNAQLRAVLNGQVTNGLDNGRLADVSAPAGSPEWD